MGFLQFSFFKSKPSKYSIGFYNVENLFDTIADSKIHDEDFTPEGKNKWTSEKYQIKLDNLSRVISNLGEGNFPAMVGLAEIENRKVLDDLIRAKYLVGKKYGIIHRNSKDERGIDVAAIYRTDLLKELSYEYLSVDLPGDDETREILYVKAKLNGKYPIHVFFNHWPSRREGEKESEPKRILAAKVLETKLFSLRKEFPNDPIFILGDFNDEPNNKSIYEIIGAGKTDESLKAFVNLSYCKFEKKEGTHSFNGQWNMIDQVIVSRNFFNKQNGLILANNETQIFKEDWVLFKHKDGNITPSKSYSGPIFHKTGYSDHLAIYVSLEIKK